MHPGQREQFRTEADLQRLGRLPVEAARERLAQPVDDGFHRLDHPHTSVRCRGG
jgi:hypothetical protein